MNMTSGATSFLAVMAVAVVWFDSTRFHKTVE